ncbi:MAG: hypothetical protein DDT21_01844 [Syntrophomonadaceae bacterium]|nr:hypothetical protein [Bacillota bacterium]
MLATTTITTAVTGAVSGTYSVRNVRYLALQAAFVYGSGGTNAKAWVQTSLDDGTTWIDIAEFTFTTATATRVYSLDITAVTTQYTPTEGTLTANTSRSGILGDKFRVKYTTTGTYAGSTTLTISSVFGK